MANLQTTVSTYNTTQRATKIYKTVVDIFDWDRSSDCVTPFDLALRQLQGVNVSGTLCVPGAGIGTYVVAAMQLGFRPENIYAVELDPKYYELGSAMLERFGVNYVLENYLEWNPCMKFDVVVGNPPYQGGDLGNAVYKSLWPLFWKKSFDLLKPGGIVSLITPATWCSPTSDLAKRDAINGMTRLWDVFNSFTSRADVTDVKGYFPGVGSTFSAVTVDTSGSEGLMFSNGYNPSLGFYPLSGEKEVEKELSLTDNIGSRCRVEGKIREGVRVSLLKSRKIDEVNVEVCESLELPKTGANPSLYSHIYCESREQAEYVRERILECRDILYKHCRYNGFIDLRILGMISLTDKGVAA